MSTVTTANCACCGPRSGSGSGSGDGGSGSGGDDTGPAVPCGDCFGPGTPHPDTSDPATVSVTFLDQGEEGATFGTVSDDNWEYIQAGPQGGLPNLFFFTVYLCAQQGPTPGVNVSSITLNFVDPGGSSEAIELTILNCRPYVAVGTSAACGRIVVTGNY